MLVALKRCPDHCPHGPFPYFTEDVSPISEEAYALCLRVANIRNGDYPRPLNMPRHYNCPGKQAKLKVKQMIDLIIKTPVLVRAAVCTHDLHSQLARAIGLAGQDVGLLDHKVMRRRLEPTFHGLMSWSRFYDVSLQSTRVSSSASIRSIIAAPPVDGPNCVSVIRYAPYRTDRTNRTRCSNLQRQDASSPSTNANGRSYLANRPDRPPNAPLSVLASTFPSAGTCPSGVARSTTPGSTIDSKPDS